MIRRLWNSFGYAAAGLLYLVRTEPNFRIHLVATALAVSAGAYAELDAAGWCLLFFAIGFVLSAEAFNTAIEALVDLASPVPHPLARIAKDVAAAAVLLAALTALGVGVCLFGPLLRRLWAD